MKSRLLLPHHPPPPLLQTVLCQDQPDDREETDKTKGALIRRRERWSLLPLFSVWDRRRNWCNLEEVWPVIIYIYISFHLLFQIFLEMVTFGHAAAASRSEMAPVKMEGAGFVQFGVISTWESSSFCFFPLGATTSQLLVPLGKI